MKEEYTQKLADSILVSVEDLLPNEVTLIDKSYEILKGNLNEIKHLNDEVKRLNLELKNLKAMKGDLRREYEEEGKCPICNSIR